MFALAKLKLISYGSFKDKINPRTAIAGAVFLLSVGIFSANVIFHNTAPIAQVKGAFTDTPSQTIDTSSVENTTATQLLQKTKPETKTETQPTTATAPTASTESNSTKKTISTSSTSKGRSSSSGSSSNGGPSSSNGSSSPTTPSSNPSSVPAIKPTYSIVLRSSSITSMTIGTAKQLLIPFDVVYDTGFTASTFEQPLCGFTTTPVANHGALCDVGQKEANSGTLLVQYGDTTAKGNYVVWMSYSVNGIVRTDSYSFTL